MKRCDKCGWPMADKPEDGCVQGNCSYATPEWERVRRQQERVAMLVSEPPAPCPHGSLYWQEDGVEFEADCHFETRGFKFAARKLSERGSGKPMLAAACTISFRSAQDVSGKDRPALADIAEYLRAIAPELAGHMVPIEEGERIVYFDLEGVIGAFK